MLVVLTIMKNHFVLGLTWARVVQCALQPCENSADKCAENCAESCAENCAENRDLAFDFDSDRPSRTCFRKVAPKKKIELYQAEFFRADFRASFRASFGASFRASVRAKLSGKFSGEVFDP